MVLKKFIIIGIHTELKLLSKSSGITPDKVWNRTNPAFYGLALCIHTFERVRVMMFNATFNNISVISWCRSVLLVKETGELGENHRPATPLFSNFLFTNLFSITFLYFFINSSLFPYFNLFVSIFIQSYVNIKLPESTLLDTNNTQGMQLGRFKNRTPARFEYIYCTLFPLCHSN